MNLSFMIGNKQQCPPESQEGLCLRFKNLPKNDNFIITGLINQVEHVIIIKLN